MSVDPNTGEVYIDWEDRARRESPFPQLQMSLRDYFAAKALTGIMTMLAHGMHTNVNGPGPLGVAKDAYEMADAMLEARKK